MDIKEIGFEVAGRIHLAEDGTQWRSLMNTVVIKHVGKIQVIYWLGQALLAYMCFDGYVIGINRVGCNIDSHYAQ